MRHFSRVSGTSKQQVFLQVQPLCKKEEHLRRADTWSPVLSELGTLWKSEEAPLCVCGPQEPGVQSPAQQQASPALHLPPETFLHLSS